MNGSLRFLHLEDDQDFTELVRGLLRKDGLEADIVVAASRAEFDAALDSGEFDLILADYLLPDLDGLEALRIAAKRCPQTPVLVVSGTIGEQAAIDTLKAGARDYVLKLWPERLAPAVRRALQENRDRLQCEKAQARQRESEHQFRELFENSPDAIFVENLSGVVLDANPAACRLHSLSREELLGRNVLDLVPKELRAEVEQDFKKLAEGQRCQVEGSSLTRDGLVVPVEIRASRIDYGGKPALLLHVRDVTDRRLAETALRNSEMLFHSVWDNSVVGMRLTNEQGSIVEVNDAYCKLVGMERSQLEGRFFSVVYAEGGCPSGSLGDYRRRFQERVLERHLERRLVLHNGQTVNFECTNSYLNLRGQPTMLLAMFKDVTAQKQLEDQLRQSQKMEAIGQLAGGVAHDFNNILTVIQGHASLLTASANLAGPAARSAHQIVQAAERAAALTRQLLAFSRRQLAQPRRLNLNEVVGNMSKMLGRILGEDVALQLHYCPEPAAIQGDAGMIEQVLMNLAVNARDAMPRGGTLTIRISICTPGSSQLAHRPEADSGAFCSLTVSDTGCGIPPENLGRIFEPFFTTKQMGKGTGLGLATVYGIVKQHRGWVDVESAPGRGATFRVFFPQSEVLPVPSELEGPEVPARGGSETILVVEDEAMVRELVCGLLAKHGYRILQAESGVKALELWRGCKEQVDLLLTDLVMPDRVNGRELAEKLRSDRPNLKVLFTSGYSAECVGKDFVLERGLNYLQKPYPPRQLAKAVRQCLDT